MTTKRKQVSLWLQEDEYQRLKDWADGQRRKVATAAKVIIFERLDHDEQAGTPEGCAAR